MQSNSSSFWKIFSVAVAAILLAGGARAQLDAPHNTSSSGTGCLSCHQMDSTSPKLLPDYRGTNPDPSIDNTVANSLCWSCHIEDGTAPYMPTHSSEQTDESHGQWTVECWVCHNQHSQEQLKKYGAASYVYTGTFAGVDNSGPDAVITVTGTAMVPDQFAGYLVVPNTAQLNANYKIINNTANTLTVRGLVNTDYAAAGNPLAISYGKFIKAAINLADIGKSGGKTVRFFKQTGANSFADGDPTNIDGVCEVCHTVTSAWRNNGNLANEGAHKGLKAKNCTQCHPHAAGFQADYQCLDCHADPTNTEANITRANVKEQFSGNSHHVQRADGSIQNTDCYQCHWEADSNGKVTEYHGATPSSGVNLVIRDSNRDGTPAIRPDTYTLGITALEYTAGSSTALDLNPHCLGCHNDDLNNYTTGNGIFSDGKAPNQYAWDGTCSIPQFNSRQSACLTNGGVWTPGTSVDARYSQTDAADQTTWGKYTTAAYAAKKSITKAYSAHGNAANNSRGWDTTNGVDGTINNTSGSVNVACFDCHNAHGSTSGEAGSPTASYVSATATGGILKETSEDKGGYSVTYKPAAGGSIEDKNERNPGASLCLDCHLTPAGLSQFGYETPWGYQSTFQAVQPIIGYFDSPYLAPGSAGPQQRYPYKNIATNAGGHFGASRTLFSSPMHAIDGLCTPCHDPHGVSPNLSNQQYGVPLLKGTWLTSPYKEDAAPSSTNLYTGYFGAAIRSDPGYHIDQNTFTNSPVVWDFSSTTGIDEDASIFGGLCLNCHTNDGTAADIDPDGGTQNNQWKTMDRIHDTVKGWGSVTKPHKFPCSKCHTPHNGSVLPRLMVTNCLDFKHRGRKSFGGVPSRQSVSGTGDCGDPAGGSGGFPGGGQGSGIGCEDSGSNFYGFGGVSCHDNVGTGEWPDNQAWNQVTLWVNNPPAAPTIVDEPDTTSTSVTLAYSTTDPEEDAVEYYVAVDDASNFSSPNYNSGWISETDFTLTVANNKTWYWRVKARDASNESGWSTADSFMVSDGTAPGQVILGSPANGAKITTYPSDVMFAWNAQPALAEYRLWVDDESGFATPHVYDSGWINTASQTVNISTAGTYYWRVQARDSVSHATGTVSATRNIIVNKPPAVPVLTPEPDTTTFNITLDWIAPTDPEGNTPVQYYVEVDDASNFSSPNYFMNWSTATSYSFTAANNIWYWRVKAKDSLNNESGWSSTDSFDIYIPGAPAVPTLAWPPDGYSDQVGYPAGEYPLQWNASSGATEYYCEYWGAGTGNSGWTTATSFNPGDLADNNYFFWRVKARNPSGESGWSVVWSWYDYWDGGSCPFVFVWNGEKFEYVTDLQGAPIGYLPSSYLARFVPYFRPLYVVLDNLKPDEFGTYSIKLRETLPEISYIDEAKLMAVDIPAGYELVSSTAEMTYRFNYADPFRLYAIQAPRPPDAAVDNRGADVLASVLETDGNLLPMELFALDSYTFDFGLLDPANAKLVLDGWSVFGSTYATPLEKVQPYIEVVDADGQWVKVKSFGQPSGDMERMAIDLSGMFLSDDHRVRLHTGRDSGMAWRIDKVMIDDSSPVEFATSEMSADYADLHFRGKAAYSPSTLEHRITAEDDALPASQKAYGYGKFTKYGDVQALLETSDDMYAIMRHGDEIRLTFSDPLGPVAEGMKRMFVLKADVYYKVFRVDKQVEPLPFHGMSIYPYDTAVENYPDDAAHQEYRETCNTREFVE